MPLHFLAQRGEKLPLQPSAEGVSTESVFYKPCTMRKGAEEGLLQGTQLEGGTCTLQELGFSGPSSSGYSILFAALRVCLERGDCGELGVSLR